MVSRMGVFGVLSREFTIREAIPYLKHFQNIDFGTLLLRMGLLCRADTYHSNYVCAALRAMTGPEWKSAFILFGILQRLLKLCSVIQNFWNPFNILPLSIP